MWSIELLKRPTLADANHNARNDHMLVIAVVNRVGLTMTGEWSFLEVGSAGECLPQWTCDAPMISGQRMRARIEVIPLEAGYPPLGGFLDTESYMHLPARRYSIHTPRTRWGGKNARCKSLEKSKDNAVLQSPM